MCYCERGALGSAADLSPLSDGSLQFGSLTVVAAALASVPVCVPEVAFNCVLVKFINMPTLCFCFCVFYICFCFALRLRFVALFCSRGRAVS